VSETGTESKLTVHEGVVAFTSKVNGTTVDVGAGQSVTATASGLGEIKEDGSLTNFPSYIIIAVVSVAVLSIVGVAVFLAKRKSKVKE